jgi:outer membrane protein assembly factor BamD (BamD/ComL family)
MGRKQVRTGKYLLFCLTGLIFSLLTGCALFEKKPDQDRPAISSEEKEKIRQKEALAAVEKKKEETARAHLLKGRTLFAQGDWEGAFLEAQIILAFFPGKTPVEEALFMQGLIHLHPDNPNRELGKALDTMKKVIKDYPNGFLSQQAKAWIGLVTMQEKIGKENEKLTKDHDKLTREFEKMSKMLEEYKKVDIEIERMKREKGR